MTLHILALFALCSALVTAGLFIGLWLRACAYESGFHDGADAVRRFQDERGDA